MERPPSSCICTSVDLSPLKAAFCVSAPDLLTGLMSSCRPSPGWGGCGGSSTWSGSTSGVYTPECTSSSAPTVCLAKPPRTCMSHHEARRALRPKRARPEREARIDASNPSHVLQPAQTQLFYLRDTYLCCWTSRHAKPTKVLSFYDCSETCWETEGDFIAHVQLDLLCSRIAFCFVTIKVSVKSPPLASKLFIWFYSFVSSTSQAANFWQQMNN